MNDSENDKNTSYDITNKKFVDSNTKNTYYKLNMCFLVFL